MMFSCRFSKANSLIADYSGYKQNLWCIILQEFVKKSLRKESSSRLIHLQPLLRKVRATLPLQLRYPISFLSQVGVLLVHSRVAIKKSAFWVQSRELHLVYSWKKFSIKKSWDYCKQCAMTKPTEVQQPFQHSTILKRHCTSTCIMPSNAFTTPFLMAVDITCFFGMRCLSTFC